MTTPKFSIYADGSSGGNATGSIGWGWVVVLDDQHVLCAGNGGYQTGTNNQAELIAAREGIRALMGHPVFHEATKGFYMVELVSDSQYVLGLASGRSSPTKNVALAVHLHDICQLIGVQTRWVKGHAGHPVNEMCDRLAKAGKELYAPRKTKKRERRRRRRGTRGK